MKMDWRKTILSEIEVDDLISYVRDMGDGSEHRYGIVTRIEEEDGENKIWARFSCSEEGAKNATHHETWLSSEEYKKMGKIVIKGYKR